MMEIIICILCSFISYYIGLYIGMKKGVTITKKAYREFLNQIL